MITTMKQIFKYIPFAAAAVGMIITSCSSEEDLQPSNLEFDYYALTLEETGPEAQIRKDFYNKNKTYLFFNQTVYSGPDKITGEPREERLDPTYGLYSFDTDNYIYEEYTTTPEQQQAVEDIQNKVFSHLLNCNAKPYALYLVKDAYYLNSSGKMYRALDYYTLNRRVLTVPIDYMQNSLTETRKKNYFSKMLYDIIKDELPNYQDKAWDEFFSYCNSDYFGQDIYDMLGDDWDQETMFEMGYWVYSDGWWTEFYEKSSELQNFMKEMFKYTPEDFEEEFGQYPIIVAKYNAIKKVLDSIGFEL